MDERQKAPAPISTDTPRTANGHPCPAPSEIGAAVLAAAIVLFVIPLAAYCIVEIVAPPPVERGELERTNMLDLSVNPPGGGAALDVSDVTQDRPLPVPARGVSGENRRKEQSRSGVDVPRHIAAADSP